MRPSRIKVLGKPFTIKWLTEGLDADLLGECDSDKQLISVRDGQPLEQEQDTLLHEVLHAIDEAMLTAGRNDPQSLKRLSTPTQCWVKLRKSRQKPS